MEKSDIKFNDFFVTKTYEMGDDYKLVISYNFKEDSAFYEVLTAPGAETVPIKFDAIVPILAAEQWIYAFNDGALVLVDRYEKDIIKSTTLIKDSMLCQDQELLNLCIDIIKEEMEKHAENMNKKIDEILFP